MALAALGSSRMVTRECGGIIRGEFVYLIRPDGHVGLFQCPIDADALQTYLTQLRPAAEIDRAFGRAAKQDRAEAMVLSR